MWHHRPLDAVEYFAGDMAVTNALRSRGYITVAFEKCLTNAMDIMSDQGYALALALCLRLRRGGLALLAPVCSALSTLTRSD